MATQQFLYRGWWAPLLPFCLKVPGFHQLKKSRRGQGRWMTSMGSRYFQGLVIETNEPCYISWDTESCCSKIQRLIELKLEAPNLSADHQCHEASDGKLAQSVGFTARRSSCLFIVLSAPNLQESMQTCTDTHISVQVSLSFEDFLTLPLSWFTLNI